MRAANSSKVDLAFEQREREPQPPLLLFVAPPQSVADVA
jgi:hypothetical protein